MKGIEFINVILPFVNIRTYYITVGSKQVPILVNGVRISLTIPASCTIHLLCNCFIREFGTNLLVLYAIVCLLIIYGYLQSNDCKFFKCLFPTPCEHAYAQWPTEITTSILYHKMMVLVVCNLIQILLSQIPLAYIF